MNEALNKETNRVKDIFPCPHCASNLTKDNLQRDFETQPDPANGKPWKRVKFRPALISYAAGGKRYEKKPDPHDLEIVKRIEAMPLPVEMPTNRFPIEEMYHGSRDRAQGLHRRSSFFSAPACPHIGRHLAQGKRPSRRPHPPHAVVLCRTGDLGDVGSCPVCTNTFLSGQPVSNRRLLCRLSACRVQPLVYPGWQTGSIV